MQALPPGWKPCYDEELGSWYYFNFRSGESRWEHPLDDMYRNLVRRARSESISSAGEEDSKTSAKEDLKSYEEAAPTVPNTQLVPRSLEPLKNSDMLKKGRIQLAPLKKSPALSPLATSSTASPKELQLTPQSSPAGSKNPPGLMNPSRDVSSAPSEVAGRSEPGGISTRIDLCGGHRDAVIKKDIPSPTARIDIDSMDMGSLVKRSEESAVSRKERLLSAQERHPRSMAGRGELTLTGGGSVFLKSKQQKQESPVVASSSPTPGVGISSASDVKLVPSRDQAENLPKSILRGDQQRAITPGKPLWDVDPREMSSEEKQMWRRQELEEERKSVRFNLEQELDIRFNLSDLSDHDGEEQEEEDDEGEDWNSDEEDPDEERLIAGIKVSDILNLMDASDLEEASAREGTTRNKSHTSVHSLAGSKRQESLISGSQADPELTKHTNRPGIKSVNGTRFTIERVHEHVLLSSSQQSEGNLPPKQPEEVTVTEPDKECDPQYTRNVVSNVIASTDVLSPVISSPHSVAKPKQGSSDVLSDKMVKVVDEISVTKEDGELKRVGNQEVNYKPSAKEGQGQEVQTIVKPAEKTEEAVQKEHQEILEAGQKEYQEQLAGQQKHEDELAIEIQKLEKENEKALQRHREILAQRLEESISRLEIEQQKHLEMLRCQLTRKEEEDEARLKLQLAEKMAAFESDLKTQQENREKCIRENMEASLQELRETLAVEHGAQIQTLKHEEEKIRLQRAEEFEKRLEDDRVLLEQQTSEHAAKFEQELAQKLEKERAQLERAHYEHLQELIRKNELENEATITQLQAELSAHKDELQQAHLKEMTAIDVQIREMRTAKLLELDEATRRNESIEKLKSDMEHKLEQKRLELTTEHEAIVIELKAENALRIEKLKLDLRMEEEQVRREHTERLNELRARLSRELELEQQRLLKPNEQQSDSARQELLESSRVFEKLRCEKRLLEDKYRSLKEKYIRLKTDVKISMERRKRRDAGGTTTGSETERSTSHKAGIAGAVSVDARGRQQAGGSGGSGSAAEKQRCNKKQTAAVEVVSSDNKIVTVEPVSNNNKTATATDPKNWQATAQLSPEQPSGKRGEDSVDSDNISSSVSLQPHKGEKHSDPTDAYNTNNNRRRRQLFGRLKSSSTSRLLQNNNNNNSGSSNNSSGHGETCGNQGDDSSCSPVENLRRQLQKLEDLEDQFPASTHTDTYLRYPFTTDSGGVPSSIMMLSYAGQLGSSELEFFRHRIHLERDSVRRAKDFLRAQRTTFQSRQKELKQRQLDGSITARNMLDQLYQEERELTDMEVSLHRTRSLLGEKIIRLRHLEQSLHRASSPRPKSHEKIESTEHATLSDLSSHSGSSGFSSTELGTDIQLGKVDNVHRHIGGSGACGGGHYQESTEIIQSLENLNTEIREIWGVLNKQQKDGTSRQVVPPPLLVYPNVGWPMLVSSRATATPAVSDHMQALQHQAQQKLSTMGQFTLSSLPRPQNVTAQLSAALGQTGASELTQLGTALAHQNGTTPFRTSVLPQGGSTTITDPSLVERTRSLRDWLRQARIESTDLISPGQATL
ncbi:centrosomal protein of 164 kDa isoform X3 [Cryptotermes secundus]|nr:centrosomal protein of 164 kDa isoform X3 [Cryptotermes secundus]